MAARRIATDAVMKVRASLDFELLAMRLVDEQSTIPIPAVRRILVAEGTTTFVMEYIPGKTLKECWPDLSLWQRIRVIWTIRGYIRQLRRIRPPGTVAKTVFPGPVASEPQICNGPMFTEYVGRCLLNQLYRALLT